MFLTPQRACRVSFSTEMGKERRDLKGKEKNIGGRSGQIQKLKVPKAVSVLILFVFAVLAKISLFYLFFHRPTSAGSNGILTPSQQQQQRLSCSNTELAPPSSPTPLGSSSTTATFVPHHKSPRLQDFRRLLSIETRQVFVTHLINCWMTFPFFFFFSRSVPRATSATLATENGTGGSNNPRVVVIPAEGGSREGNKEKRSSSCTAANEALAAAAAVEAAAAAAEDDKQQRINRERESRYRNKSTEAQNSTFRKFFLEQCRHHGGHRDRYLPHLLAALLHLDAADEPSGAAHPSHAVHSHPVDRLRQFGGQPLRVRVFQQGVQVRHSQRLQEVLEEEVKNLEK